MCRFQRHPHNVNALVRYSKYHTLPTWCVAQPMVTSEMATMIRKTWRDLLDEKRNMRTILDENEWRSIQRFQSGQTDENDDGVIDSIAHNVDNDVASQQFTMMKLHVNRAADGSSQIARHALQTHMLSQKKQEHTRHGSNEAAATPKGLTCNSPISHSASNGSSSPDPALELVTPSSPVARDRVKLTKTHINTKTNAVLVFEMLLKSWTTLDPSVTLVWSSTRDAVGIISRMVAFFVKHCEDMDTTAVQEIIRHIAKVHQTAGVQNHSFDTLARALMITLKRVLGKQYTHQVNVAWVTAFSKFFAVYFVHCPATQQILIRTASDNKTIRTTSTD